MNRFVALIVIVAVFAGVQGDINDPKVKATIEKCVAAEEPSPADIEALKQHSSELSKAAKCFMSCMMKEYGLLTGDGKLHKDVYMAESEALANGDAAKLKHATEMYAICEPTISGSDLCEIAYTWAECIKNEMIARNMSFEI